MLYTHKTLYGAFTYSNNWESITSNKISKYILTEIIKIGYTPHTLEWRNTIAYVCIDNQHFFYIFGFSRDYRTVIMNKDI